jgi:hypothetical protein
VAIAAGETVLTRMLCFEFQGDILGQPLDGVLGGDIDRSGGCADMSEVLDALTMAPPPLFLSMVGDLIFIALRTSSDVNG